MCLPGEPEREEGNSEEALEEEVERSKSGGFVEATGEFYTNQHIRTKRYYIG